MIPVTTTIRSTTGTQPITFDRISPELVMITTEDGASQIYYTADLIKVCKTETTQEKP